MTQSTIERAYALARSGRYPSLVRLKQQLNAEGCRAVDALLAPRSVRGHLEAICAAAFKPPAETQGATTENTRRLEEAGADAS
jgi:hypothetical protein